MSSLHQNFQNYEYLILALFKQSHNNDLLHFLFLAFYYLFLIPGCSVFLDLEPTMYKLVLLYSSAYKAA